jgi:hypothetical protein
MTFLGSFVDIQYRTIDTNYIEMLIRPPCKWYQKIIYIAYVMGNVSIIVLVNEVGVCQKVEILILK